MALAHTFSLFSRVCTVVADRVFSPAVIRSVEIDESVQNTDVQSLRTGRILAATCTQLETTLAIRGALVVLDTIIAPAKVGAAALPFARMFIPALLAQLRTAASSTAQVAVETTSAVRTEEIHADLASLERCAGTAEDS